MKPEHFSRRRLLVGASAAAVAMAPPAGTALVAHPTGVTTRSDDTELLAVGKELEAAWAIEKPLWEIVDRTADLEARDEATHEAEDANLDTYDALQDILEIPANTIAGLALKARAFAICNDPDTCDPLWPGGTTDHELLRSMISDLLRLGGYEMPPWTVPPEDEELSEHQQRRIVDVLEKKKGARLDKREIYLALACAKEMGGI